MRNRLFSRLLVYFHLLRLKSWAKNFFVFVPAVFAKMIFDADTFYTTVLGFATFSIASSAVYVLNDIVDAPKDMIHPLKKNRPIASGQISTKQALVLGSFLYLFLALITFKMNLSFMIIVWIYVFINILYTAFLKEMVIVDIFCIASGFMLRVIGGGLLISVYISKWMILTTMFLSLFLAVMKRRVEIANSPDAADQRTVLKEYSLNFIDQIVAMTGSGVILSYALYSVADKTVEKFGTERLIFTTVFVIFGIFRYMYLVYKKDKGENVIEVILADLPMVINLVLYVASALLIIYFYKIWIFF